MGNLTPAQATLISACIAALASIIVGIINSRNQRKKFAEDMRDRDKERETAEAVRDAELKMWMKQVDRKLDLHNGYAERFSEISKDIAVIKNDIKTLYRKGD